MKDKELEEYYNTYRGLFASEGFKLLTQDLTNNAMNINSIEATKDANDMYFRKGQMSIIASIINLEQQIVAAEESIEAAELEEEE
jgi:ABC-type xylose transport system substrate-binding protein